MRSNKTNTQITSFSAFQKLAEDVYSKQTLSGAIITTVGAFIILVLFLIEFIAAISPQTVQKMGVDTIARTDPLEIFLNITMHAVPCSVASVDYFDETGHAESNSFGMSPSIHIIKRRLNEKGQLLNKQEKEEVVDLRNPFWELTKMLQHQAQHQHEVEEEYEAHEGCNLYGTMEFERVRGSFRIIIHTQEFMLMKDTKLQMQQQLENSVKTGNFHINLDTSSVNTSHTIHHLSFGPIFQGQVNSLNNVRRISDAKQGTGTFKYFLNIVPTTFETGIGLLRRKVESYQYSDTEFFQPNKKEEHHMNAVYFFYDLYPISIQLDKTRVGLISFLLRISAVVGGGFAIMGLLDKIVNALLKLKVEGRIDPFSARGGFGQASGYNPQLGPSYSRYKKSNYDVTRASSSDPKRYGKASGELGFAGKKSVPESYINRKISQEGGGAFIYRKTSQEQVDMDRKASYENRYMDYSNHESV